MLFIERPQTDPYFNIAAEEYLLKKVEEDCFMLWVNEPAVIIGKHQNAFAEINRVFVRDKGIPVIRRISGGGTVFHDPGNLNFTFISRGEREQLVDFRKFTAPVIDYLNSLGLPARFEGKNDIRINGLKVSGNAEHVYRDRVLHHGTLLFSSGLGDLNRAIRGGEKDFQDKAVRSVRSTVSNIVSMLDRKISMEAFREGIIAHMQEAFNGLRAIPLTVADIHAIRDLAETKYRSWEWNYGYSPKFTLEKTGRFRGHDLTVRVVVDKGLIRDVRFKGPEASLLGSLDFSGLRFNWEALGNMFPAAREKAGLTEQEYDELLTGILY